MLIVLTTAPNLEEAETLAQKIVEAKLAACVQISPPIISFYVWKDELQKDSEHQLFIKTLAEKYGELEEFIKANHSYETPEIVAVSADDVSLNYSDWVKNSLR
jgi:periplasmic divalent cation tolerance protein